MKVKDIIGFLNHYAPLSLQESYDNAGLLIGDESEEIEGVLITVDVTEEIVDEAIQMNCKLIVAHHPLIFEGLKKITGSNYVERIVKKALVNDIAVYASHTNLDNLWGGVNTKIADKLGVKNYSLLSPLKEKLLKLVYFVPVDHAEATRRAVFEAGAGHIGDYDSCSYNLEGFGTFKAGEGTDPFVGKQGQIHQENEMRIEVILPDYLQSRVLNSLLRAHPYEEVAYDLYPLKNQFDRAGMGVIGELDHEMKEIDFLNHLKETFDANGVRYSPLLNKKIKKVAICGGSGSFLIKKAITQGADVFVTGDMKYHQFFDADKKILIADVGHYESEQVTKELFYEILTKKFPKFAIRLTEINSNPINYL